MPELTIGRMAKLYGLHRSTLYEAVEKSRVTAGFNGKGQRVIELSEMIRVYGEPPGKPEPARQNPTPSPTPDPTPDSYRELVEELRALRQEVRELKEQMRLLPAPPRDEVVNTPPERPETPPQAEESPVRPKGTISFADIEARLQARLNGQS